MIQLCYSNSYSFFLRSPFLVDQRPRKYIYIYTALPVEMILLLYISGGSVVWNRELGCESCFFNFNFNLFL